MKKKVLTTLIAVAVLFTLLLTTTPARAEVDVDVHIGVAPGVIPPIPTYNIPAPPPMIVIPNTYVYAIPDIEPNIVFYQDHWYRQHQSHWYRASHYNGPWISIAIGYVPGVVVGLPSGFRRVPPGHQFIPWGHLKKNWRGWEEQNHWGLPGKKYKGHKKHKKHKKH